jgi:hypothetical protein
VRPPSWARANDAGPEARASSGPQEGQEQGIRRPRWKCGHGPGAGPQDRSQQRTLPPFLAANCREFLASQPIPHRWWAETSGKGFLSEADRLMDGLQKLTTPPIPEACGRGFRDSKPFPKRWLLEIALGAAAEGFLHDAAPPKAGWLKPPHRGTGRRDFLASRSPSWLGAGNSARGFRDTLKSWQSETSFITQFGAPSAGRRHPPPDAMGPAAAP